MYQLYYFPLNASMAPHFILEALQVDFELIKVDRQNNAHKSKEYLALNPAGRIPTLVDEGQTIFESPAICIHLAESHPKSSLIPPVADKSRADFYQWMMYLTNTLQAELMLYFYPEKHTTDQSATGAIVKAQEDILHAILLLLDKQLTDKKYLLGDKISICDYFFFMLAIWADELPKPPLAFKHLNSYLKHMAKLPAIINACKTEQFSLADYQ